jgi:hypothetical protein
MKYKVVVPNVSVFIKAMRERYSTVYGNMKVRAIVSKKNTVSIIQKGDGLNPVDLIDSVLDEHGGKYV